jgi:hypothetical protein
VRARPAAATRNWRRVCGAEGRSMRGRLSGAGPRSRAGGSTGCATPDGRAARGQTECQAKQAVVRSRLEHAPGFPPEDRRRADSRSLGKLPSRPSQCTSSRANLRGRENAERMRNRRCADAERRTILGLVWALTAPDRRDHDRGAAAPELRDVKRDGCSRSPHAKPWRAAHGASGVS